MLVFYFILLPLNVTFPVYYIVFRIILSPVNNTASNRNKRNVILNSEKKNDNKIALE